MKLLPLIIAAAIGVGFAFWMGETVWGYLAFTLAGLLAGGLVNDLPRGSEAPYWIILLLLVVLLALAFFGTYVAGRLFMMTPVVFILAYFIARIVWRLQGGGRRA